MLTEKQIEGVIHSVLMGEFSAGIFKKDGRDYVTVRVDIPYDYKGPALCDEHHKPIIEQDLDGEEFPKCYQCLEELYYPKNKESQAA